MNTENNLKAVPGLKQEEETQTLADQKVADEFQKHVSKVKTDRHMAIVNAFKEQGLKVAKVLEETYSIEADKMEDIVDYGIKYQSRNPKMKPERMARKIAEYFNLKKLVHASN